MKRALPARWPVLAAAALAVACADSMSAPRSAGPTSDNNKVGSDEGGGVFTMTNGAGGNSIVAFRRAHNGSLTPAGSFATGGVGTGGAIDPLASQYSLIIDFHHMTLIAVNAGSNDISVFRINNDMSLTLIDREPSGGTTPVSLAINGSLLYVLNAGSNTVSSFHINGQGGLGAVSNGTRSLADGAAGASTIRFSNDGRWVIVSERSANRLEAFPIDNSGRPGVPVVTASHGATPFGFAVTPQGQLVVTEAGGAAPNGAVSSYGIGAAGGLSSITGSLNSQGGAACWVVIKWDGSVAFVVNAASNTIATFALSQTGNLSLLQGAAASTGSGTAPIDLDIAGSMIYVLEAGVGRIASFLNTSGGALSPVGVTTVGAGASGMQGLAVF